MKKKVIKTEITSNRKVARDHFVMELEAPYLAKNAKPGQFVNVKVSENTTDPLLRIPLGIHAVRNKRVKMLYKVVGQATEILSAKRKGEMLDVLGPIGNGYDLSPLSKKGASAALVAGGHGVAPLYGLAEAITKRKKKVAFFTGAGTADHIVCDKELRKLGVKVYIATEDGSQGKKCYVTDILKEHFERTSDDKKRMIIYACGPRPMLAAVARFSKQVGVPAQVSLDAYMACGTGACLGCAIETVDGYKLVCKDGPVFDAQEIRWDKI
jgi:dihydroorotate dehydrogenase electron transfer subunit